jgi:aspartate 1-decarboxylase
MMQRHLMKSKIHRATITSADLHYEGSLTVDQDLLDAADLREHEEVQVVNVNNGARFSTYVIPGPRGSGVLQLNGAAARLGMAGDLVIVISYGVFDEAEAERHAPTVVFVDERNRIVRPPLRAEG